MRILRPDLSVVSAFLNQSWSMVSGVVLLILVTWRLSETEQGYYFSFSSIMLTQSFLDLGFGIVLTQFVSHEWAALRVAEQQEADALAAAARLGSLVRLSLAWYTGACLAFFLVVGTGGYLFFHFSGHTGVDWVKPWWLLSGVAALGLLTVPLSSLTEGAGRVARNQTILLVANAAAGIAAWTALLSGAGLYALGVLVGVQAVIALPILLWTARPLLKLRSVPGPGVSWRREFLPQQRRIALSWFSGFVVFQSITPITFAVRGPVAAGQLGATLQIYRAVDRLSSAWLVAVQPRMGHLGSQGKLNELRQLVGTTTRRSVSSAVVLSLAAIAGVAVLGVATPSFAGRFGGLAPTALFLLTATAWQVSNVTTAAVRFQKRDPFVINALCSAILVAVCTALLGARFGLDGVAFGFAATMLVVVLPWTLWIYRRDMQSSLGRTANITERRPTVIAVEE